MSESVVDRVLLLLYSGCVEIGDYSREIIGRK
jgi:hypothetical protein